MFTEVQDVSDRERMTINPRMSSTYQGGVGGLETIIDVYLTEADLAFLDENRLIIVRDPTVEDGIMVGSPMGAINDDGLHLDLDGNITASFALKGTGRFENGATPLVFSTAHQDGRGDSDAGTCVRFFNADEA